MKYDETIYKKIEIPLLIITLLNFILVIYQKMSGTIFFRVGETALNMMVINAWTAITTLIIGVITIIIEWRMKRK